MPDVTERLPPKLLAGEGLALARCTERRGCVPAVNQVDPGLGLWGAQLRGHA